MLHAEQASLSSEIQGESGPGQRQAPSAEWQALLGLIQGLEGEAQNCARSFL